MNTKLNINNKINSRIYMEQAKQKSQHDFVFGDRIKHEVREIDKHEIIVKMAEMLGPSPSNLNTAEKIFEKFKFLITSHTINHEFGCSSNIGDELLVWLDTRSNPDNAKKLNNFFSKFVKRLD